MKKNLFAAVSFLVLIPAIRLNAQQQEMYTFCTGNSYCYLIDTSATSSSGYFQRFNTGTTSYVAHFYRDTIYQTAGSAKEEDAPKEGGNYSYIRKWAWTGNNTVTKVWTYAFAGHHDICPMPNGNVLAIIDETINLSSYGGPSSSVKSPVIKEIRPTGSNTGTVVWEWHLKDHLCQSTNASYTSTFVSSVAQHPELFNMNCSTNGGITSDWFHMNGLDYNPVLNQIVMSSHVKNEIYIIDHSTTTAQAATHSGGNSGRGGDFLYRWGSPENYGCTTDGNGVSLNVIHDARWVASSNVIWPGYISVFHNGGCSSGQGCVLHLPPYSSANPYTYTYTPGSVVGPTSCTKPTTKSFTVANQGGCMALDNGNVLITSPGTAFYETRNSSTALQSISVSTVQSDRLRKKDVFGPWPWITPSSSICCVNNPISLNCNPGSAAVISSPVYTYSWTSVPATVSFSSATAQNPSVTASVPGIYTFTCTVSMSGVFNSVTYNTSNTTSITVDVQACTGTDHNIAESSSLVLYPNPTRGIVHLNEEFVSQQNINLMVINSFGEVVFQGSNVSEIDLSDFANGIYYLRVTPSGGNLIQRKIILLK